ncbi:ribosomal-protein-alanine acetyltransferase [Legionella busanensis]|uniref:Ribosomal-protein-alanine acetyltransferase n=1 Tax=Legionella busanensis TaxID=190655 RepID=A0A378KB08_9GAMM|nr:GNAT family N-acetyltransferase [Legionella busanensis]STX81363.1 ribosomal-protein-alanine acetyltransferase [Legionella busanensis]
MKSRFFEKSIKPNLYFEWNAARNRDWLSILRNFVGAYLSAYIDCTFEELQYPEELKHQAEAIWDRAYAQGYESLINQVIHPLKFYLNFNLNEPLKCETNQLEKHFLDKTYNISLVREKLIKLILLQHYFEHDFSEEKHKIDSQAKKIDYLIARFHDKPIAFFACEYNYKSAHVYLRFVTLSPSFHRLGLGEKILDEIVRNYPDATGMELYTRNANFGAQAFYKHYRFNEYREFEFKKPILSLDKNKLYFPDDDATNNPGAFIAFSKLTHSYHA